MLQQQQEVEEKKRKDDEMGKRLEEQRKAAREAERKKAEEEQREIERKLEEHALSFAVLAELCANVSALVQSEESSQVRKEFVVPLSVECVEAKKRLTELINVQENIRKATVDGVVNLIERRDECVSVLLQGSVVQQWDTQKIDGVLQTVSSMIVWWETIIEREKLKEEEDMSREIVIAEYDEYIKKMEVDDKASLEEFERVKEKHLRAIEETVKKIRNCEWKDTTSQVEESAKQLAQVLLERRKFVASVKAPSLYRCAHSERKRWLGIRKQIEEQSIIVEQVREIQREYGQVRTTFSMEKFRELTEKQTDLGDEIGVLKVLIQQAEARKRDTSSLRKNYEHTRINVAHSKGNQGHATIPQRFQLVP